MAIQSITGSDSGFDANRQGTGCIRGIPCNSSCLDTQQKLRVSPLKAMYYFIRETVRKNYLTICLDDINNIKRNKIRTFDLKYPYF